jgi:hypothetical protein
VPALNAVSAGPSALEPFAIRESIELKTMHNDTDISTTANLVDTGVLPSETESSSDSDIEDGEYDDDDQNDPNDKIANLKADSNPSRLLNFAPSIADFYDKLHLMRCDLYFVDLKGESEGLCLQGIMLRDPPLICNTY